MVQPNGGYEEHTLCQYTRDYSFLIASMRPNKYPHPFWIESIHFFFLFNSNTSLKGGGGTLLCLTFVHYVFLTCLISTGILLLLAFAWMDKSGTAMCLTVLGIIFL